MNTARPVRLLTAALLGGGLSLQAASLELHLAPGGNDQWTGQTPELQGPSGPLASLPAALKRARGLRMEHPADGIRILVHGGTYWLTEPMVLGPEDSGLSPSAPLEITSYREEHPVFSAGLPVRNWHPVEGRIPHLWEGEVARGPGPRGVVRSFFVSGERRTRARTPNEGYFRIDGPSPTGKPMQLRFHGADIKGEWAADDVEVIALLAWSDTRMLLQEVDARQHLALLGGEPRPSNREANARYFVENAPDGLDAPGEWQYDDTRGVIRYIAREGEDPRRLETVAGGLGVILRLQGDTAAGRPLHDVLLRGLTFSHTDWTLPSGGFADTQAAVDIRGDIRAEGALRCTLEGCRLVHLAGYGLELGRGCQQWRVVGNELGDLGAGGIRIGVPSILGDAASQTHSHWITDNEIHDGGKVFHAGIGVLGFHTGTNHIAHNHIHHFNYTAISLGWNWGYRDTPSRANLVEFNHLHDIGQGILSDMGAVYTLGPQPGTVIRNNLIHNVDSFTYGGWGLYPDEGSTGILWENNVVHHCKSAGFHQHYGKENIVRNNIFAFGREHQVMRTRDEEHLSFYFTNNIVCLDSGKLLGDGWKNDRFVMEGNLYWDFRPGADAGKLRFTTLSLEEWRRRGHDLRSVVADPLFESVERNDYRLRPGSPALALGFHPIDLTDVGVRPLGRRGAP
ncbi:MAG TPA: hypothetical protein DCM86_10640 [Verrucomicrobiales bacterium]|nr:hypothetical protein [Verrucomicrobiales bacterium]